MIKADQSLLFSDLVHYGTARPRFVVKYSEGTGRSVGQGRGNGNRDAPAEDGGSNRRTEKDEGHGYQRGSSSGSFRIRLELCLATILYKRSLRTASTVLLAS